MQEVNLTLRKIESPFLSVKNTDINSNPEILWEDAEANDLILAKPQSGDFSIIFPNRPYTPDGVHFLFAPRTRKFETIQSVGLDELDRALAFLLPIIEEPGGIIGYNESFDISLPSAKSWKNLHFHGIVLSHKAHRQSEYVPFTDLFELTNHPQIEEETDKIIAALKSTRKWPQMSITKDSLGLNLVLPQEPQSSRQLAEVTALIDNYYRELTTNQGSYVLAIKKFSGNIVVRLVLTTNIVGKEARKFGLMEALGYSVERYPVQQQPDRNALYYHTLVQVYNLLSAYSTLIRNDWEDWYFKKDYIPAAREAEQETRHKAMFNMITKIINSEDIKHVIEVGVGSGTMLKIVKKLTHRPIFTHGIDLSYRLLVHSRNLSGNKDLIQANTFTIPLPKQQRNQTIIFHQGLLEHFDIEDMIAMLREQLRVAKYVVFSVPSVNYIFPQGLTGNERLLSLDAWLTLLKNTGFKVGGQYYGENEHEKYHLLVKVEV